MTPTTALRRLRLVLAANALFSLAGATVALVAAARLSRELGIDNVALTRVLGAGLLLFGLDVGVLTRQREERVLPGARLVSIADACWVAATIVVVAAGVLTTTGTVVAVAIGLAVADFAATQTWFRSKATRSSALPAAAA